VEERFERHFLGLQRRVGGMHHQLPMMPPAAEFFDDDVPGDRGKASSLARRLL
jgi:hypothetical protein